MVAAPNSRNLTVLHQEALTRERYAWQVLEHLRVAGTAQERQDQLAVWIEANRTLRALQAQLTARLSLEATSRFQRWLDVPPADGLPVPDAADNPAAVPLPAPLPSPGQRLRARDGSVWWVEAVAIDELDPRHFLAQMRRGPQADAMEDSMEIFGDDWPLVSRIYGLSEIPEGPGQRA